MLNRIRCWWNRTRLERLFDKQISTLLGGDFSNSASRYLNYKKNGQVTELSDWMLDHIDMTRAEYKRSTEEGILRAFNPEPLVEDLTALRGKVIDKAIEMDLSEGDIPFLPVIPKVIRDMKTQISLLSTEYGPGTGDPEIVMQNYVGFVSTWNLVDHPSLPYFIFNVSDGSEYKGLTQSETEDCIQAAERRALTAEELVALALHTDDWENRETCPYIRALNARLGDSEDKVPFLTICSNRPYIGAWSELTVSGYGTMIDWETPSCSTEVIEV